jgi:hypothetical protein
MMNFAKWFQPFHSQQIKTDNNSIHTDGTLCAPATGDAGIRQYHKEKANLRLVRKDKNLGRSYLARNRRQKKDLKIE